MSHSCDVHCFARLGEHPRMKLRIHGQNQRSQASLQLHRLICYRSFHAWLQQGEPMDLVEEIQHNWHDGRPPKSLATALQVLCLEEHAKVSRAWLVLSPQEECATHVGLVQARLGQEEQRLACEAHLS